MTLPTVVGHEHIWSRLIEAAVRDRLPHALLFAGPSGIGKALVARRLATWFVCTNRETAPCGVCVRCVQFAAQSHPDCRAVELLPGKKEISIDLIRQLKRFVQVRAVFGTHKIALIDDAERLSIAAQNALLKTLEEPPAHSVLIMITASAHALLPTVRSRCHVVAFQPLTPAQVETALAHNAGIEPDLARALAGLAQGSPGHALQLRTLVESNDAEVLRQLLAELNVDRYVTVVGLAKNLGRTEQEMTTRLELLQSWYHTAAVRAALGAAPAADDPVLPDYNGHRAARAAAIIGEALTALQRRNPNRPLLAEAVALQLARN